MKILVTGFSSFPGVEVNPCEEVVAWIAENYPSNVLQSVILPVSYMRSIEMLVQCIESFSPDVVIEFGVSSRAKGLKLESMSYNSRNAQIPDVDGVLCVHESIESRLSHGMVNKTKWQINKMFEYLRERCDIPLEISNDPGRYVCNNIYWKTMNDFPNIPTIFIHIPPLTQNNRASLIQSVGVLLDWTLCNPQ